LTELESGVYDQAKEISTNSIYIEKFCLTTPCISEAMYEYTEDELRQFIRPIKYENTNKIIDQFVDLNQYLKQEFEETMTTEISHIWCNRISTIDQSIFIGIVDDSTILQYNTSGECVAKYNNTHETIVVKQACNGDIITGGNDGLYDTDTNFNQWTLLQQGKYSDIAIHGNKPM
jgi:hypothetical protein